MTGPYGRVQYTALRVTVLCKINGKEIFCTPFQVLKLYRMVSVTGSRYVYWSKKHEKRTLGRFRFSRYEDRETEFFRVRSMIESYRNHWKLSSFQIWRRRSFSLGGGGGGMFHAQTSSPASRHLQMIPWGSLGMSWGCWGTIWGCPQRSPSIPKLFPAGPHASPKPKPSPPWDQWWSKIWAKKSTNDLRRKKKGATYFSSLMAWSVYYIVLYLMYVHVLISSIPKNVARRSRETMRLKKEVS